MNCGRGLTESDKFSPEDGDNENPEAATYVPKVGDYVQWESQGVMRFKEPVKVLSLSTDRTHAFVEGTSTGLPVNQLHRAAAPITASEPQSSKSQLLPNTNMQEDVLSLSEGRVVIQWPSPLSAESIQDLKDWLKIVERKITRSVKGQENGEDR